MTISFDGLTEEQVVATLSQSLAKSIAKLQQCGVSYESIGAILANTPAVGVAMKGVAWKGNLWQAVKAEFHSFLCTDSEAYADLRSQWGSLKNKGSTIAISTLSAAVGAKVGVAGGVVVPLVVWLAASTIRLGKQALCTTLTASQPIGSATPPA